MKIFLGIIVRQHRSETNGTAKRAVRRIKEETSSVLLQSGLDEWWAESVECYFFTCETFKMSCLMGRHHMKAVRNVFYRTSDTV